MQIRYLFMTIRWLPTGFFPTSFAAIQIFPRPETKKYDLAMKPGRIF
jgi:hypothetical protein